MIIILEGVDGSGKTTLANELKKKGFPVMKWERHIPIQYQIAKAAKESNCYIVLDRSFISDIVYRIYDEGLRDNLDLKQIADILDNNVTIIYCKTNTSFVDSMSRGEDNVTTKEQSDKLSAIYDNVIKLIDIFTGAQVRTYNWQLETVNSLLSSLEEYYGIITLK